MPQSDSVSRSLASWAGVVASSSASSARGTRVSRRNAPSRAMRRRAFSEDDGLAMEASHLRKAIRQ